MLFFRVYLEQQLQKTSDHQVHIIALCLYPNLLLGTSPIFSVHYRKHSGPTGKAGLENSTKLSVSKIIRVARRTKIVKPCFNIAIPFETGGEGQRKKQEFTKCVVSQLIACIVTQTMATEQKKAKPIINIKLNNYLITSMLFIYLPALSLKFPGVPGEAGLHFKPCTLKLVYTRYTDGR